MRSFFALLVLPLVAHPTGASPEAPGPATDGLTPEQVQRIEDAFVELPPDPAEAPTTRSTDYASVIRFGGMRLEAGDYDSARIAFEQAGRGTELNTEREAALAGLARTYRQSGDLVKAAATYERLLADHAGSVDTPMYLLELGRTLRALGAPKLAVSRFYSVLHSVLKVPAGQSDNYRQIARTAQFEIAETHFETGNFAESARFFTRLNLLDLAPADRNRAAFKAALAQTRAGQSEAAIVAYRQFIDRHPDDPHSPEARFQLATLLHGLGRRDEARQVTLELLRHQSALAETDTTRWQYWQRRTGNQLANDFYGQGDYTSALAIYRSLADLGGEPRWRLAVLYQMALCQERLHQTEAARDIYSLIRKEIEAAPTTPELQELERMAVWRLGQLDWVEESRRNLDGLTLQSHAVNTSAPDPSS